MDTGEFIKIQDMFNDLFKKVELLSKERIVQPEALSSASTKNLMDALAKAQSEYTVACLNRVNPYVKNQYADYVAVVEASRPALTKYGIAVKQPLIEDANGALWLYTNISLGDEWTKSKMRVVVANNDVQHFHSYVTFLRRINYCTDLGVCIRNEDDDAEAAMAKNRELFAQGTSINHDYDPMDNAKEFITKEQIDEFNYELKNYPDLVEDLLIKLKIRTLADMPKGKFRESITRAREIKGIRENSGGKYK